MSKDWLVVPLLFIVIILLFVIATKGPADAPAYNPPPVHVTVEAPVPTPDCRAAHGMAVSFCRAGQWTPPGPAEPED